MLGQYCHPARAVCCAPTAAQTRMGRHLKGSQTGMPLRKSSTCSTQPPYHWRASHHAKCTFQVTPSTKTHHHYLMAWPCSSVPIHGRHLHKTNLAQRGKTPFERVLVCTPQMCSDRPTHLSCNQTRIDSSCEACVWQFVIMLLERLHAWLVLQKTLHTPYTSDVHTHVTGHMIRGTGSNGHKHGTERNTPAQQMYALRVGRPHLLALDAINCDSTIVGCPRD